MALIHHCGRFHTRILTDWELICQYLGLQCCATAFSKEAADLMEAMGEVMAPVGNGKLFGLPLKVWTCLEVFLQRSLKKIIFSR